MVLEFLETLPPRAVAAFLKQRLRPVAPGTPYPPAQDGLRAGLSYPVTLLFLPHPPIDDVDARFTISVGVCAAMKPRVAPEHDREFSCVRTSGLGK